MQRLKLYKFHWWTCKSFPALLFLITKKEYWLFQQAGFEIARAKETSTAVSLEEIGASSFKGSASPSATKTPSHSLHTLSSREAFTQTYG